MVVAWKIRFNGFGRSDYTDKTRNTNACGLLTDTNIDMEALAAPPFYQPQGPSHFGGSFAAITAEYPETLAKKTKELTGGNEKTPAERTTPFSNGCKLP